MPSRSGPALDAEVLVVGAGPVGCWLAAELCAAGVRVMVVEARQSRAAWSRGFVVHPRTLEILASRGAAAPLLEAGRRLPTWHFAMGASRLDFTALPTSFPFVLIQPQAHTEQLLEEYLNRLGGSVQRGRRVAGLEQHADRVTVRVREDGGERTVSARFVVGCDGAHSAVREAAGIAFTGDPDTMVCPTALVELADPPPPERYMQSGEQGLFFAIPLPDGRFVVSTVDHAVMHDIEAAWTADTVRASLLRVTGSDYGMGAAERLSSIGNSAKQAERYRDGRVLLAGDAAHVHFPMGGQGMNLGIQDAHNLAWRLAGAVRIERAEQGEAGGGATGTVDELLDGYEAERRPAGERVLEDVRAQMALVAATGADGVALRARFDAVLGEHPQVNLQYARRLSGIDVRYPMPDADADAAADERLGRRVPDLVVEDADGAPNQLYDLLREVPAGRFVRLSVAGGRADDGSDSGSDGEAVRVRRVLGPDWALRAGWDAAGSLLIRPDGHVAEIQP